MSNDSKVSLRDKLAKTSFQNNDKLRYDANDKYYIMQQERILDEKDKLYKQKHQINMTEAIKKYKIEKKKLKDLRKSIRKRIKAVFQNINQHTFEDLARQGEFSFVVMSLNSQKSSYHIDNFIFNNMERTDLNLEPGIKYKVLGSKTGLWNGIDLSEIHYFSTYHKIVFSDYLYKTAKKHLKRIKGVSLIYNDWSKTILYHWYPKGVSDLTIMDKIIRKGNLNDIIPDYMKTPETQTKRPLPPNPNANRPIVNEPINNGVVINKPLDIRNDYCEIVPNDEIETDSESEIDLDEPIYENCNNKKDVGYLEVTSTNNWVNDFDEDDVNY